MNTSLFRKFTLSASLLLLPLLAGCSPQTSASQPTTTDAQAGSNDAPAMLASAAPAPETSGAPDPAPPPDPAPVPVAPDTSTVANELPPDIYPASPLAQVIRLTQAGVDQSVVQTFIANASGTFNLDSDKIIYLRDVGVPNEVVTAMIQHDQQLRQQAAAANPPPAQPAPDTNTETGPPPEPPTPPPAEVTVNNFYGALAPYGTWVNVDGYGRCWRPSVVAYNPGWQPYCDNGHWVYTNCGWYWYSDYSWGWAPFHYGRWFQHPNMGWCWTPDTVWGPSWVTWRYSNNYCGWAPLPPFAVYRPGFGFFYRGSAVSIGFNWGLSAGCFTFIPTQFFCDPHPRSHCVARSQVSVVFNQTAVVNNFNVRNHNFVNQGIDPEHITAVTRVPIHPVALHHTTSPYVNAPHQDQFNHEGNTLVVNHPDFADHPAAGGNRNHSPTAGAPAQNHFLPSDDHHPGTPPHSTQQPQVPVVTTHSPQAGNAVYQPPQQPTPPASYNPPTSPHQNNRTDSPRGWEQHQPRGNAYNSETPAVTPAQPQPGAPAAVPAQPHSQHNQPASPPPASAPQRSSGQNQNQNQGGSGNNSGGGTGHSSNH